MTAQKWHKGPPPSIGWWPASVNRASSSLRWWDGAGWSHAVFEGYPLEIVIEQASMRAPKRPPIEWADRPATWPARSRT